MGQSSVLNISFGRGAEGVNVTNEMGFKELNGFFKVIHLRLVGCFLGGELLVELLRLCF